MGLGEVPGKEREGASDGAGAGGELEVMPRALTLSWALGSRPGSHGASERAQRACSARHGSSPPGFPSRVQGKEGEEVEAEL